MYIVRKLSEINEGLWSSVIDRSMGNGNARREDERTNFRNIKFIDCGCSVLWADKNLIVDDDEFLDYDTYMNLDKIIPEGHRLPTVEEYRELINKNEDKFYEDPPSKSSFYFKKSGVAIELSGIKFGFHGCINIHGENDGEGERGLYPTSDLPDDEFDEHFTFFISAWPYTYYRIKLVPLMNQKKKKYTIRLIKEK